jgi:DeoR/GlpR family transcriptional regulator of sugar metabolism
MILDWMQEEGSARVRDLSEAFSVSEATVRQDLERLEAEGHIVREHGGAFLKSVPQQVRALALHHLVNMEVKARIGSFAAALVNDGETIILDSGSTTTEVAKFVMARENLNVITNALNIALILGAQPSFSVHVTGGQFKAPTLSLSGEKAADFFSGIYAEKLFLAAAAVSLDAGLTYPSVADLYVKKAMIEAATHTYLVVDSTKIGKKAFSSLGGIELIDTLITDEGITPADQSAFEKAGVDVLIAK